MKKKLQSQNKWRGYEQVEGQHYDADTKAAPVVNEITIHIVFIFIAMAVGIYMKVPERFEKYYGKDVVLLLLKTIYGLKQAAYAFWCIILQIFADMKYTRSKADPCLYFAWITDG